MGSIPTTSTGRSPETTGVTGAAIRPVTAGRGVVPRPLAFVAQSAEAPGKLPHVRGIARVYGPYTSQLDRARPRRFVIRIFEDGTRETTSYARHLVEVNIGRELGDGEEVDHKDDNQLNDDLSNLHVITPRANRGKGRSPEMVEFACPICGELVKKEARRVRHNRKQGKAGPFCGKRCARQHQISS